MDLKVTIGAYKSRANSFKYSQSYPKVFPIMEGDVSWYTWMFGRADELNMKTGAEKHRAITKAGIKYSAEPGILHIPSKNISYCVGWLVSYSIGEIATTVATIPSWNDKLTMSVEIATDGTNPGTAAYAAEENDIFQVPAQFNGLQNDYQVSAERGIQKYPMKSTYGRQCALACAPGLFVRNWDYNYTIPGNSLSNIENHNGKHVNVDNGYLKWGNQPESVYDSLAKHYNDINIASQIYTQVCGPVVDGSECTFPKYSVKLIHQVFASTASVNTNGNTGDKTYQDAIVASLQQAAYYGTLGMAVILANADNTDRYTTGIKPGRKTVNLTLIGTDLNNDMDMSLNMMVDMLKMFKDYPLRIVINSGPLKADECYKRLISKWPELPIVLPKIHI
jgi:hypothetical protein